MKGKAWNFLKWAFKGTVHEKIIKKVVQATTFLTGKIEIEMAKNLYVGRKFTRKIKVSKTTYAESIVIFFFFFVNSTFKV